MTDQEALTNQEALTDQEALIELNRLKTVTTVPPDPKRQDQAIRMAMDALRKQVPRKPEAEGENEQDDYFCPSCNTLLCTIGDSVYWGMKPKYCDECGQALDWG